MLPCANGEKRVSHLSDNSEKVQVATGPTSRPAPCKLITQLSLNPNADITQIPLETSSSKEAEDLDGMQCTKAYQLLMQFATTEEKLDTIAHALETGCVGNKGSGGGCKVKNQVLWKALEDVQR
jgi:hypothetical protein